MNLSPKGMCIVAGNSAAIDLKENECCALEYQPSRSKEGRCCIDFYVKCLEKRGALILLSF